MTDANLREFLQKNPLFKDVEELPEFDLQGFSKNDYMAYAGSVSTSLKIILSGSAKVSLTDGDKELSVSLLGPNQWFGDTSLLDQNPSNADIVAMEPVTVIRIEREELVRYMNMFPVVSYRLFMNQIEKVHHLEKVISDFAFRSVSERLLGILVCLAKIKGIPDSEQTIIPSRYLTCGELAKFLGVRRWAVSRCMANWARKGLLQRSTKNIYLPDTFVGMHPEVVDQLCSTEQVPFKEKTDV